MLRVRIVQKLLENFIQITGIKFKYMKEYDAWCKNPAIDDETKNELLKLEE